MWQVTFLPDPLALVGADGAESKGDDSAASDRVRLFQNELVHASIQWRDTAENGVGLVGEDVWNMLKSGGRTARVALADFVARRIDSEVQSSNCWKSEDGHISVRLETLDVRSGQNTSGSSAAQKDRRRARRRSSSKKTAARTNPYMMERTDIFCAHNSNHQTSLHVFLRVLSYNNTTADASEKKVDSKATTVQKMLHSALIFHEEDTPLASAMLNHVAVAVWQDRLRNLLKERKAVAFIPNGSILPRKSGASYQPMASPPAIPFEAPIDSNLGQTLSIDMGLLAPYLQLSSLTPETALTVENTTISLKGLMIPCGVSLIVGGGYHGKSTLLRCIAAGVYNRVPGDGRELGATVVEAVTVRAEDGRYVNHCNVSAFIANLPNLPGNANSVGSAVDTTKFSSKEASGSTSQASNVCEALEMGASALLVDEDTSAANFMARDGRMRALVMDESITPLLYRVNGLYVTHGVSTIVVVGGVGDWLDVPHNVILMDKYVCRDATAKAQSVSRQFSHGHVQYAGRGVVHRLEWPPTGQPGSDITPRARRPTHLKALDCRSTIISLLDGGSSIALYRATRNNNDMEVDGSDDDDDDDDEDCFIDLSRCEQLLGKKPQLYGCGLCVAWLLEASRRHPDAGFKDLMLQLDSTIDSHGMLAVILGVFVKEEDVHNEAVCDSESWNLLVETLGHAGRPRRFEVGQALTRFRGVEFTELPGGVDEAALVAQAEATRKKQEMLDIWNSRRKK